MPCQRPPTEPTPCAIWHPLHLLAFELHQRRARWLVRACADGKPLWDLVDLFYAQAAAAILSGGERGGWAAGCEPTGGAAAAVGGAESGGEVGGGEAGGEAGGEGGEADKEGEGTEAALERFLLGGAAWLQLATGMTSIARRRAPARVGALCLKI